MNYEHKDGFEELPGKNQRNRSVREGGRAGRGMADGPARPRETNVQRTGGTGQETPRRPQRDPRENAPMEESYQGRPVRRQEPGSEESYGRPGSREQAADRSFGAGRTPGNGRQTGAPEGQGLRRPAQGARPAGAERAAGTGRVPGDPRRSGVQAGRQPGGANTGAGQTGAGRLQSGGDGIRGMSAPGNNIAARETAAGSSTGRIMGQGPGTDRARRKTAAAEETPREALAQAKIQRVKQKKRKRRIIAMILAECLTLTVIFTYAYFARRLNMIQREDFNKEDVRNEALSVDDITKMKGYWMIAVFGVDSRSTNVSAGVQADVNMICCINQDTGEIKLVSVYRDTYLNINDSNSYRKINAAYTNGGPEQALKALNKNLDLDITDYVTFSWKAVAEGINILGGVDVEITRQEFRYINAFITETVKATNIGSHQLPAPGLHHLDGVQAVAYGRLRLMDTDYARTERQRKIIELAFAKAKQADYPTLNNILVTTLPSISTNLDFADLTNLALSISKYHIGETAGFPFAKGNANLPGKGDCVIPQTLESNVSQLHTFLFGDESYTPTEKVRQISSKIAADSGMHREGKPSTGSALATDSYVPETTAKATTEAADPETSGREEESQSEPESTRTLETDENGNLILYPDMTDEDGNLIDAPIDDWPEGPEDEYPGGPGSGQNSYGPSGSNSARPGESRPTETRPSETRPGESGSRGPGGADVPESSGSAGGRTPGNAGTTSPGSESSSADSLTPGQNTGPGVNAGPGGSTGSASETVSSGGNSPGRTDPSGSGPSGSGSSGSNPSGAGSSGSNPSGTGSSGISPSGTGSPGAGSSGTSPSGTGSGEAAGPGSATQPARTNPSPQESSSRQTSASQEASQPSGQTGAGSSSPGPGGESQPQGPGL